MKCKKLFTSGDSIDKITLDKFSKIKMPKNEKGQTNKEPFRVSEITI